MKISQLDEGVGRIVKGVNTTPDVGVDQTRIEAAKFGNTVDKDGRPPSMSSAVKGKSTNVLFNLGLTEGILLKFERDKHVDVLHIMDTKEKHRIEVRGKKGYESGNHDYNDKLHQVLDALGKAANFAELMNGETVSINPKHPHGSKAMKTAKDVLQTESLPKNPIDDVNDYYKQQFSVFKPGVDYYLEDGITLTPDVIRSWGEADDTLIDMLMDYYKSKGGKVNESRYTAQELALLEGGHTLEETVAEPKKPGRIFSALNSETINETIRKVGSKYVIYSKKGKRLGSYSSRSAAEKRLRQIEYFKHNESINEEDVAWQSSLSKKLFDPANWTNNYEYVWGLWLPLSPSIINQITNENIRNIVFHVTGIDNLEKMIQGQGKKRSISAFNSMWYEYFQSGVQGGGGSIYELDANILGSFEKDVMSAPDKSGMRWIVLEKLVFEAKTGLKPMVDDMGNLIKQLLKKYSPEAEYKNTDEAVVRWTQLGKKLNAEKNNQVLYSVIKDYIDGTYALYRKYSEDVLRGLRSYLQHRQTDDDWDELVVNDYKIKQIHLLKNVVENPKNKKFIELFKKVNVPIKIWDKTKDLYDYIQKVSKDQGTVNENFADGKVKGKSRPGRVKKAGASCKGSVTDLRKRAKKYSGERGRMYHWCANMKSGKKKK